MRGILRLFFVLFLLVISAALARAGTIAGVDGMTSTVMQQGQSSFSGLGVRVRLRSARLVEGFELMPAVEYWRNSSTVETFGIRTTRRDATLGVDARYSFRTGGWHPYVGGGLGLHFITNEVDAPSLGLRHASDSVMKGGLAALAGTSFALTSRLDNFIELKYHHLPGYSQLKINWGLAWGL
ncbi:MAG: outer membrane beta-barrel protein [Candidatus Eisenbacteria bacterium]|nr:outer membrane beta-barrel protein [Candidatus Eisenbacteria bacterium]